MFLEIAAAAYLLGDFIYHRLEAMGPGKRPVAPQFQIPTSEAGRMIPLVYGKCRVRTPVLAWLGSGRSAAGSPTNNSPDAARVYRANMHIVVGIPFAEGRGSSTIDAMWMGDGEAELVPAMPLSVFQAKQVKDDSGTPLARFHGGVFEVLDGNPAQDVDSTTLADVMQGNGNFSDEDSPVDPDEIAGYRGYLSIGLYGVASTNYRWQWVDQATIPAYSFEASSYANNAYPALGADASKTIIFEDANPADVIYDILVSPQKLGIPTSAVDAASFAAARATLWNENHGFSYCFDEPMEAHEIIGVVLKQIDGAVRNNPTTGKIEIKLVRADFDPASIPHITKDNCVKLQGFAMGHWSNVANAIDVVFPDREHDYQDRTVSYDNQANVAQHGSDRLVLRYPGCTRKALAETILKREVECRSRPVMKCRAIVDRSFLRVSVGDAVKLTWSKPDIAGVLFRVAAVDRGTLEDGAIALDLVQDVHYVWRGELVGPQHDAPELDVEIEL